MGALYLVSSKVSPATFAHFSNLVLPLANGRVVGLLEGGYFPTSLAESAAITVRTFLGDPCPELPAPLGPPRKEMADAIRNAKIALKPYWKCFGVRKIPIASHHIHVFYTTFILHQDIPNDWKTETKWLGPTGPPPTEFDPMSPTPPRPKETDEEFERRLAEIIERQDLQVPNAKLAYG